MSPRRTVRTYLYLFTAAKESPSRLLCGLVLSWDGEVSAVSKDAIEDALNARSDTVIDEWDEEFDRGKVNVFFFFSF